MVYTNISNPVPAAVYERKINALVWLAAIISGTLWMAHYVLQLCFGLMTGNVLLEQQGAVLWRLDAVAFFGAYLTTGLALIGLSERLAGHSRASLIASDCFAMTAVAGAMLGGATGLADPEYAQLIFPIVGKSIFGLFLSALILGGAGLRYRTGWHRSISLAVFLFGLLTLPLGLCLGLLEQRVPMYTVTELHFVFPGAVWLAVAVAVRRSHGMYNDARRV